MNDIFLEDSVVPRPGYRWRHVVISTWRSWLPGDARGWRARRHKQHSSGDYRHRPPVEEHAGLRRFNEERCDRPVVIPPGLRGTVGRAMLENLREQEVQVLAISVSGMHAHLLVELPDDPLRMRELIGQVKRRSSRAIRQAIAGKVWATGGGFKPIDDPRHHHETFDYILTRQGPGAWTWSFREGESFR